MAIIIRQLRALVTEAPLRQKKSSAEPKHSHCRKSLTVKISKDPPHVVYFERDTLEDSFECIFDPQVHHDEEKDHPDLAEYERRKALKPWQKDHNPSIIYSLLSHYTQHLEEIIFLKERVILKTRANRGNDNNMISKVLSFIRKGVETMFH
ncbi:hypothetical protein BDB01DRAFT_836985 [Pilobolus umbonatus]|nr:hypothetical protein BDB01DRAFT_836985 [Pilobolus umbonatus]